MRGKAPQKDNSERYLLTYADLMNLLLILFIVLFCMATKDVSKQVDIMTEIAKGFNANTSSTRVSAGIASSGSTKYTKPTSDYSDFYNQLYNLFKSRGILDKVGIVQTRNEVVITLKDTVLFAPGKDELGTDATSILTTVGSLLTKISYGQILVEGHTDSDPISTAQFRDNMELSLKRAYNVYNVFKLSGVNPATMQPQGYGDTKPVAKNDTDANKAKNRRVVITIMGKGLTPPDETVTASQLLNQQKAASMVASSSKLSSSLSSSSTTSSGKLSASSRASSSSAAK